MGVFTRNIPIFITGLMGAGKSSALKNFYFSAQKDLDEIRSKIIGPNIPTPEIRTSKQQYGKELPYIKVNSIDQLHEVAKDCDILLIEEVHLFNYVNQEFNDMVKILNKIQKDTKVICVGLEIGEWENVDLSEVEKIKLQAPNCQ